MEAWRLFDPVLEKMRCKKPIDYTFGSLGPTQADDLCNKYGFNLCAANPW